MSEALGLAMIAAVPPTLAAIVSALVLLRDGRKRELKLDAVHGLVNSRLEQALAEIAALKAEVRRLRRLGPGGGGT